MLKFVVIRRKSKFISQVIGFVWALNHFIVLFATISIINTSAITIAVIMITIPTLIYSDFYHHSRLIFLLSLIWWRVWQLVVYIIMVVINSTSMFVGLRLCFDLN